MVYDLRHSMFPHTLHPINNIYACGHGVSMLEYTTKSVYQYICEWVNLTVRYICNNLTCRILWWNVNYKSSLRCLMIHCVTHYILHAIKPAGEFLTFTDRSLICAIANASRELFAIPLRNLSARTLRTLPTQCPSSYWTCWIPSLK